ncbi:MAG: cyclic nucleotide-binding domain-containing protein [Deltaproteobacteria bacterium]|nr:cyclic nucleotide-binding domain-containing protein [Deltaproteobacteria bacterium]
MKKKGIYSIAREETYDDGQVIFDENSSGDWLYVILRGSVETSRNVRNRKYIIERLQPDEVFGEMELVGGMERTVTARAVGKTTLGVIDLESMKKEYNQLSKQFRSILETIPLRLKKMLDRACDFSG